MQIAKIQLMPTNKLSYIGIKKDTSHTSVNLQNIAFCGNPYGKSLVELNELDKLKRESTQYPKDLEYRKQLMANAGLDPAHHYKVRSIIGAQEIKNIMSEFDGHEERYSAGINDVNVKNNKIRANLHIHTMASDGFFSTSELLNQAATYADKVKRNNPLEKTPFVIAITDHDTTESAKEAIKIISEDPLKYKNLRVILGVEMTTFNNFGVDVIKAPTNTHVLAYGVDPNERVFDGFIQGTKYKKSHLREIMTNTANKVYKKHFGEDEFFDLKQARRQHNQLDKNIIGIYNQLDSYFLDKLVVDKIITKSPVITDTLNKFNQPVETNEFMERMGEYYYNIDHNNKVHKAQDGIPEFISAITDMKKEEVSEILERGLKDEKIIDFRKDLKENLSDYKVTLKPKYNYMPTFKTLYDSLKKQKNTIIGVAHPLDYVKKVPDETDRYNVLEDMFIKFKKGCKEKAVFFEGYYQSYRDKALELKEDPKMIKYFERAGKVYDLFKTGSMDTHRRNIFRRY